MKSTRQSNFEILRVILMIMIIMHHLVVHSLGLRGLMENQFPASTWIHFVTRVFLDSFFVVAVNVFIFISGYFGVKFKTKSIIMLVASGGLISLIPKVVMFFIDRSVFVKFSPWAYWFLVAYFVLLFVAQYVDKLFSVMSDRQVLAFSVIVFFLLCIFGFYYNFGWLGICGGCSFIHMLGMYCIGKLLRRFEWKLVAIPKKFYLMGYVLGSLVVFSLVLSLSFLKHYKLAWTFFYGNNPIVVFASASLFLFFSKIDVKINVRWISGSVFGVYLLHDNYYVRSDVLSRFADLAINNSKFGEMLAVPLGAMLIFLICVPVSFIVNWILNRMLASARVSTVFAKVDALLSVD